MENGRRGGGMLIRREGEKKKRFKGRREMRETGIKGMKRRNKRW